MVKKTIYICYNVINISWKITTITLCIAKNDYNDLLFITATHSHPKNGNKEKFIMWLYSPLWWKILKCPRQKMLFSFPEQSHNYVLGNSIMIKFAQIFILDKFNRQFLNFWHITLNLGHFLKFSHSATPFNCFIIITYYNVIP